MRRLIVDLVLPDGITVEEKDSASIVVPWGTTFELKTNVPCAFDIEGSFKVDVNSTETNAKITVHGSGEIHIRGMHKYHHLHHIYHIYCDKNIATDLGITTRVI